VHVWLSNILDNDRNIKVPCADGLIIWGCDKSPILIHKGYGIYRTKMLVILLSNFAGVDVILSNCENKEHWCLCVNKPVWFSCRTFQQERYSACPHQGGTAQHKESSRCWSVVDIGRFRCPIASSDDHMHKKGTVDRHLRSRYPLRP